MNELAQTIVDQQFPLTRRGYDPAAVTTFLQEVADQVQRLDASDRVAAAEREVEAAQRYVDELQERAAELEARIHDSERETEGISSDAVARASHEAEMIVAQARLEADDVYRHRWREAGDLVTRILEAAEAEADRLRDGAETMAIEVRAALQAEVARVRADAERHAIEVRSGAEDFAAARLASVESEREQALESAEAARAEAERVEAEARVRAEEVTRRADERVQALVTEQLEAARSQLQRLRSDEVTIAGRLLRVQELVSASVDVVSEAPGVSVGEPNGFFLHLAELDEDAAAAVDAEASHEGVESVVADAQDGADAPEVAPPVNIRPA